MWQKININPWDKYWRLTLTGKEKFERRGKRNDRIRIVECLCDCWTKLWLPFWDVRRGNTRSCGCLFREVASQNAKNNFTEHWLRSWKNRFARIYQGIKRRCENKNDISYQNYWWRWIKIIRKNIEEFYDDMYPSYLEHIEQYWEKNTTIERINLEWNYCKENCRWATYQEQANNTRRNIFIEYRWEKYTLRQLSNLSWIKMGTLKLRLLARQDVERAINEPLHK